MLDLLKKSIMASIGAAVVTRDAVIEASRRFVNEGKMSLEDAEKLADSLVDSGKKQWDEVQTSISEGVRKGWDNLDLGGKKEFGDLKKRVEDLESEVEKLKEKLG